MLSDLQAVKTTPRQLFSTRDPVKLAQQMTAMNGPHGRFGRMVRPAISGPERRWTAKAEFPSLRYYTRLE